MALWVEVYGRKRTDCSKLLKEQAEDMANVFQKVCLGYDSDFAKSLVRQYGKKKLFRHINSACGMRYQIEIDHKNKFVTILSVDADYHMIKRAA